MKYGFVFECCLDGPDYKVIKHLVKKILPDCDFQSATLGNKVKVLDECADSVDLFISTGCNKVFIVWDLKPKFTDCECIVQERDLIRQKLINRNIPLGNVEFIGIVYELESWLLADITAVEGVLSTREHPVKLDTIHYPDRDRNPKGKLKRIFLAHRHYEYNDLDHAYRIIKNVEDVKKLGRSGTFSRFYLKLTGRQL